MTATDIRAVEGEDRVRELARMLSGLSDSDTGQARRITMDWIGGPFVRQ